MRDLASAGTLGLVAFFALVQVARLDVGGVTHPGPGFFPLVLAAALLLTAGILGARAWRAPRAGAPALRPERPWTLGATLGALTAYVAVFERLGFVVGTTGFLAFLFVAVARYRWPVALGVALAVALVARLVFDTWLQVRLPPGILPR
jgi:hypothetical protein